ncbi:MAG: hypothetical protein H0W88_01815 [Parachlamydiaceae bacterium]|nr:hypothetical protein [Parachlamydiaceae bacterium]
MKFIRHLLPMLMVAGMISTQVNAQDRRAGQETGFERKLRERDDMAVRDFVQSKENIELKEKTSHLEISGDVRFEWRNLQEKGERIFIDDDRFVERYKSFRGNGAVDFRDLPISNNDWDVEFNLKFKYNFERAWAAAHLQFDNSCGIRGFNDCRNTLIIEELESSSSSLSSGGSSSSSDDFVAIIRDQRFDIKGSGESAGINLKRAYMGYNIWADGVHRIDIEMGRRKLDDVFVSEIEFSSRFDGILLKYATAIEDTADFYVNGGAFIIDERVNQFGYAGEIGFLNIYDSGLDVRYSIIDWTNVRRNRCFIRDAIGTDFLNSQISFSYNFTTEVFCKEIPTEIYGGFLINHAARKTIFTHHKKANLGWYAGLYLGEVEGKGDWAMDVEYFYVQAQAVNDTDVGGVARGNILDEHLNDILFDPTGKVKGNVDLEVDSSSNIDSFSSISDIRSSSFSSLGSSDISAFLPRRGNANYKGARIEFLYAITDNLSIDTEYEVSWEADRKIGGRHYYSNFEIEAIYAF